MAGGGRAVLLFNRGDAPAEIGFDWGQLNYPSKLQAEVRDLWQHRSLGRRSDNFGATVEPHGVVMLKVQP